MIVCDICGRKKSVKTYTLPMREKWDEEYMGEKIGSFIRYREKPVDLCSVCAQVLADSIDHLQRSYQDDHKRSL